MKKIKWIDKSFMKYLVKEGDINGLKFMLDYNLVTPKQITKAILAEIEKVKEKNIKTEGTVINCETVEHLIGETNKKGYEFLMLYNNAFYRDSVGTLELRDII